MINEGILLEIVLTAGFVSLFAAFLLLLAKKVGIVEWMQVHGGRWVSAIANCDFCMSWWLSVIMTAIVAPFICEAWLLAIPFISTPLTRHWL